MAAYISFDASGRKVVVDVDGLWGYLCCPGQAIITDAEYVAPATAATAAAAMKTINGRDAGPAAGRLIGPLTLEQPPGLADQHAAATGGTQAAAVKSALAGVARLAAAVTAYYTDISNRLGTILTESYYRLGVDSAAQGGGAHHRQPVLPLHLRERRRGKRAVPDLGAGGGGPGTTPWT